jgi:hypothetical protein
MHVMHDFYFTGGMAPGAVKTIVHGNLDRTVTKVVPFFVQFADATIWGDNGLMLQTGTPESTILSGRLALLALYKSVVLTAQGGDQALTDYLSGVTEQGAQGFAKRYLNVQKSSGTSAVVQDAQQRIASANKWGF